MKRSVLDVPAEEIRRRFRNNRRQDVRAAVAAILAARCRFLESVQEKPPIELPEGGLIVFAPEAVHRMTLQGLTVVPGLPAVLGDKHVVPL
jgi:hypothetical protein